LAQQFASLPRPPTPQEARFLHDQYDRDSSRTLIAHLAKDTMLGNNAAVAQAVQGNDMALARATTMIAQMSPSSYHPMPMMDTAVSSMGKRTLYESYGDGGSSLLRESAAKKQRSTGMPPRSAVAAKKKPPAIKPAAKKKRPAVKPSAKKKPPPKTKKVAQIDITNIYKFGAMPYEKLQQVEYRKQWA
jgi:hypothetical protein